MHKILIIDDDAFILSLLTNLLKNDNYEIHTCSDPNEAIKIISQIDFSVITTDIKMPSISGIQLLGKPEVLNSKAIKIIISGAAEIQSVITAINSGIVWRYIEKPWSNEDVLVAISNAIELYEERKLKEKYFSELITKGKELEDLNQNLKQLVEERTRIIEDRSRLLKLLATSDDQQYILSETLKSLSLSCGNLDFRITKNIIEGSLFFPLMIYNKSLGFIVYKKVEEAQNEMILNNLRVYAPVVELCMNLIEAKESATHILKDLSYLLNENGH